jgi:hypothetical protein
MTCLNCASDVSGNYCHACGQKMSDLRYTFKSLAGDLFFSAFHLEKKGLPYTIKALTLQPGPAIKAVLHGKRLTLYPPFKYLVMMGALVIIFSLRYRFFHNEITQVDSNDMNVFPSWIAIPEDYHMSIEKFFLFAEDKATILNIVAIPVFAFFSFAFLSGKRYNFAENLILNTFITAQQLFFILLLVPFLELFPSGRNILIGVYTVLIIVYNVWVYAQFFEGRKFSLVLRSAMVVLIAYVYQFPLNFLIFSLYDNYIHHHMHWIPHVYDNLVN